jgi:hypothetical protein
MTNYELIISEICIVIGLIVRPWRKEHKNNKGKLSFIGVFAWALLIAGGVLWIDAINHAAGFYFASGLGWLVGLLLFVMGGYELLLFARQYTIQQVFFGGGLMILGITLALLGINVNEQMVLMCLVLLLACLCILVLLHRFIK